MALATRCPQCRTAFQVASDQLKLRAGLVRCGTCQQIFNGIENLLGRDEDMAATGGTPAPLPAVAAGREHGYAVALDALPAGATHTPPAQATPVPAALSSSPAPFPVSPARPLTRYAAQYTPVRMSALPGGMTRSAGHWPGWTSGAVYPQPSPLTRRAMQSPAQSGSSLARQERHAVEDNPAWQETLLLPAAMLATTTLSATPAEPALPGPVRAARIDAAPQHDSPMPARSPSAGAGPELPDFLSRARQRQGLQRALQPVLWTLVVLLLLAMTLQVVYVLRTTIAARFPQTRVHLVHACQIIGCHVGLPAQIESVSIESSDFLPVTGSPSLFVLTVSLRNRGDTVQAWPTLELSLTDGTDQIVGRRVISPRDYLAPTQEISNGFAAAGEQAIAVYFDLSLLKAAGYRVYLFYP